MYENSVYNFIVFQKFVHISDNFRNHLEKEQSEISENIDFEGL